MLEWRCVQGDRERLCTPACMIALAWTTTPFRSGHINKDVHMKNGDAASIQTDLRLTTAEGADGKHLSFLSNYPYRERCLVSSRDSVYMCFCLSEGGGISIHHSSLLRGPRPDMPADFTVSDRTSPFSMILPSCCCRFHWFWPACISC